MRLIEGGSVEQLLGDYALATDHDPEAPPSRSEITTRQARIARLLATAALASDPTQGVLPLQECASPVERGPRAIPFCRGLPDGVFCGVDLRREFRPGPCVEQWGVGRQEPRVGVASPDRITGFKSEALETTGNGGGDDESVANAVNLNQLSPSGVKRVGAGDADSV